MSGTAETEMQKQIVTKTKETPFANRKQLLEELTNNESNEMEEEQMEEIEIKEGHIDVEEEQDNKAKETPIANRKVLLEGENEMEEGQMKEIEIKEGHEDVWEKQDINPWIFALMRIDRVERFCLRMRTKEKLICNFEIEEGQMEEFEEKERQKEAKETPFANRKLLLEETNNERNEIEEGEMEENEIKEGHDNVEEEQDTKIFLKNIFRTWSDVVINIGQMDVFKKKERQKKSHVSSEPMETRYKISKFKQAIEEMEIRRLEIENFERKQSNEEMKIRRLEIENFWKHALGKDMNIMRILKSGSLRFLKQQIQDVWQLLRCKVCLDSDACMVFFPCRHMATCEYCGSFLDQCPVCRTFIEKTVKVNKK